MLSNDRRLVQGLEAGEASAFARAIDQNYERIHAFLYRLSHDATLAEDLTQETFAAAWRSLSRFEGRSSFSTWLHRIALNAYRAHYRGRGVAGERLEEWNGAASPDPAPALIDRLAAEELEDRVQGAVERLPAIYREAVILRCYHGLSYREAAELLEAPAGTIRQRVHVALGMLRARLQGEETDGVENVARPEQKKPRGTPAG